MDLESYDEQKEKENKKQKMKERNTIRCKVNTTVS
jgi:hypothetical protein